MKRTKRYDEGGGIPAQTEEEAANEMELNSPAARARRNISDAENQIRANRFYPANSATNEKGELLRDDVVANSMKATLDKQLAKRILRDDPVTQSMEDTLNRQLAEKTPAVKRTPIVTKEQLAESGLSLRDYLNKQQGLTRRGESTRMPTRPGQEAPIYSNEGRNKKAPPSGAVNFVGKDGKEYMARSLVDQGRDVGLYGGTIADIKNMFKKDPNKKSNFDINDERIKNLKSGGSVSSASKRADGIAQKGKTRGKMC